MKDKPKYQWDLVDFIDARNEGLLPEEVAEAVDELKERERPETNYSLVPDRIVSLDKKKYNRGAAYSRFAEIAQSQGLIQIGHKETARHYIWECLFCNSEVEE